MLSSNALIVWLVVIFVSYSCSAPSINKSLGKTVVKHYNFPNQNVSFDHQSYNETHVVYGLCTGNQSEKNCKITLDSLDGIGKSLSCNVTIKTHDTHKEFDEVSVAILHKNRALVLLKDGLNFKLKLTNVNFHDCSTNNAEIVTDDEYDSVLQVNVVAYENSYDVFFANFKLCQKRSCRITFDIDGKIAKEAAAWGDKFINPINYLGEMRAIARHSADKGFIVKFVHYADKPNNEGKNLTVSSTEPKRSHIMSHVFVANNEGKKLLLVLPSRVYTDTADVAVSATGNYIGICAVIPWFHEQYPEKKDINLACKQYDFEGMLVKSEFRVNSSTIVGNEKRIHYMDRLNLPEGFLLFTTLCPANFAYACPGSETYMAYRLDGNGKTLKAIEISDFKCEGKMHFHLPRVFQNDAGQACVSLGCNDWPTYAYSIGVRCFTDNEL